MAQDRAEETAEGDGKRQRKAEQTEAEEQDQKSLTAAQSRKIALSFGDAYERISMGGPEIRIGDKFFLRIGTRKPDTPMFATDSFEERDILIEADPRIFCVTDRFKTYNGALARLSTLETKPPKNPAEAPFAEHFT